jgi:hypothetical protein
MMKRACVQHNQPSGHLEKQAAECQCIDDDSLLICVANTKIDFALGIAMLTIDESRMTMSWAIAMTPSASIFWVESIFYVLVTLSPPSV